MFDITSSLGLTNADLMRLNECFSPAERRFDKGEIITDFSSKNDMIGIIRQGTAYLVCVGPDDRRRIAEYYTEGDFFSTAQSYETEYVYMYITAKTKCVVDFISRQKLVLSCEKQCRGHLVLTEKMLNSLTEKSALHVNVLGQHTIRGKLMMFFSYLNSKSDSDSFLLPLPYSDLADYLAVDRSAMMRELGLMRDEELIDDNRREIRLLQVL